MRCIPSRAPRAGKRYTVYYPGGVTRLEALYIFSALAEPSSTKLVRRPRPRSANYSTLWLRLHLRLRLRLRDPAPQPGRATLPVLAARPRPGEYPCAMGVCSCLGDCSCASLPPGWEAKTSRTTGDTYCLHGRERSSQYDFPRRLKKGWRAQVSRSQGDIYYVDANGRSVYDHPGYSGCGIGSWWYHK